MSRSPILLATLKKVIIYCKSVDGKCNCVGSPDQELTTVFPRSTYTIPDIRLVNFSTKGRFLVSEPNTHPHEKVDMKRVATEIQENDEPVPKKFFSRPVLPLWRHCLRIAEATIFRHLYRKCDFCTYFTSDIGALGYQCPHCRRANWPSPGLYIAQTRMPEQPMHSVWYRSASTSYMITDDLESYPLSHHKEMCDMSDFLSKRIKLLKAVEYEKIPDFLSPDEVLKKLGKWEDLS